ncbi:MAG: helix-turn-helix domain-containing protein [Puniceicoccales bacterium]|jgi:hypothetical protein|nr:helix-turn-helix domain-containing protein [Puniceicoccales bacterium]
MSYTTFEEYKTARVEEVLKDAEEQWKKIEAEQRLSGLFRELGYRSTADLVAALQKIIDGKKAKAPKSKKIKGGKGGKRSKVTPEILAKIKELKAAGKSTAEIAKETGISTATIYKLAKGA